MRSTLLRGTCLLLLALTLACNRAPEFAPLPRGSSVLALGNSVTYGVGAGPGEDYPTRLAAISGWTIHNHGVSGDTSSGALARLEDALAESQPKLVIVEIGGNDFLRRQPSSTVKENIRAILRRVKTAGIPVVLVAVPAFSPLGAAVGRLPDADLYAELAKEEKVPLVPEVFARVLSDPTLKADTIHPNATGYRQLAEGIAAELVKTGLLAKR